MKCVVMAAAAADVSLADIDARRNNSSSSATIVLWVRFVVAAVQLAIPWT